jgi:hypothetical protein
LDGDAAAEGLDALDVAVGDRLARDNGASSEFDHLGLLPLICHDLGVGPHAYKASISDRGRRSQGPALMQGGQATVEENQIGWQG